MLSDFDTNPATLRKLDFKKGRLPSALFQFPTGFYPRPRRSTITASLWESINLWKMSRLKSRHPQLIGALKVEYTSGYSSWLCARAVAILPAANTAMMRASTPARGCASRAVVAHGPDPVTITLRRTPTKRHYARKDDRE
jgi:hypothetical protein